MVAYNSCFFLVFQKLHTGNQNCLLWEWNQEKSRDFLQRACLLLEFLQLVLYTSLDWYLQGDFFWKICSLLGIFLVYGVHFYDGITWKYLNIILPSYDVISQALLMLFSIGPSGWKYFIMYQSFSQALKDQWKNTCTYIYIYIFSCIVRQYVIIITCFIEHKMWLISFQFQSSTLQISK